jgi:hypothetical protein
MEAHDERARSRWRTAAAAVGAAALVVAAAMASPAPADTPYVVLAWAAVAVGAAVLVLEVGRGPARPASARGRRLEPRGGEDRAQHQALAAFRQVDGVVRDAGDVGDRGPVGEHRVRVS